MRPILLFLAVLAVAPSGCRLMREMGLGGDDPEWVERTYHAINRADMMRLTTTVVESHYSVRRQDPVTGELETNWRYGDYDRKTHYHVRERVLAEVLRGEEEDSILVRLRVQQQISDEPGRFLDKSSTKWKTHDDDVPQAELLLARLDALLYTGPEAEDDGETDVGG